MIWLATVCLAGVKVTYKGEELASLPGLMASDRWYMYKFGIYIRGDLYERSV